MLLPELFVSLILSGAADIGPVVRQIRQNIIGLPAISDRRDFVRRQLLEQGQLLRFGWGGTILKPAPVAAFSLSSRLLLAQPTARMATNTTTRKFWRWVLFILMFESFHFVRAFVKL